MSWLKREKPSAVQPDSHSDKRILFPFDAHGLAPSALDAALRLARSQSGTLVPVFLARVPLHLPLDAALPRQSKVAVPMQDAVEERATQFDVPVDSRIERGRSYRHAMRQTIANERFDMIVLAAAAGDGPGFGAGDVAWLLATAPGEIVVLRPAPASVPATG
jgi:nucleotide-binding universal stress UspA family protein